jgi:hypothetical protein
MFTEKKINEFMENEKRLQTDLEKVKQDREVRIQEMQKKLDKEKETMKTRVNEIEEKLRENERKRANMIFEHEKERAKWNLEKDHLVNQKNEL